MIPLSNVFSNCWYDPKTQNNTITSYNVKKVARVLEIAFDVISRGYLTSEPKLIWSKDISQNSLPTFMLFDIYFFNTQ